MKDLAHYRGRANPRVFAVMSGVGAVLSSWVFCVAKPSWLLRAQSGSIFMLPYALKRNSTPVPSHILLVLQLSQAIEVSCDCRLMSPNKP